MPAGDVLVKVMLALNRKFIVGPFLWQIQLYLHILFTNKLIPNE